MIGLGKLSGGSIRKQLPFVLLELSLIFISVFLAFSLSQWQTVRRDRDLAKTAIYNIEQEIRSNLAEVEAGLAVHEELIPEMRNLPDSLFTGKTAFSVFIQALNGRNLKVPVLERSAWDAALASGAVNQMDYDLLAAISSLYNGQTKGIGKTVSSIADFMWNADMFSEERTEPQTRALAMLLQNLLGNERYYVNDCNQVLTLLESL
jgi:hypothetical protein